MLESSRAFWTTRIAGPIARLLLRAGVSPDAVTVVGTVATCSAALWFAPRGELVWATLSVTAFAFFDLIDGTMARISGRTTAFGAFLDSTLDRIADAAVFGSLILYYAGPGDSGLGEALALYCLVTGFATSYARAKAESLGFEAKVGLAVRGDRLVLVGLAALFSVWLDQPAVLIGGFCLLAVTSTVTVIQRILTVRRQAAATAGSPPAPGPS